VRALVVLGWLENVCPAWTIVSVQMVFCQRSRGGIVSELKIKIDRRTTHLISETWSILGWLAFVLQWWLICNAWCLFISAYITDEEEGHIVCLDRMVNEQVAVARKAAPIQLVVIALDIRLCRNPFASGLVKNCNEVGGAWFDLKSLDVLLNCWRVMSNGIEFDSFASVITLSLKTIHSVISCWAGFISPIFFRAHGPVDCLQSTPQLDLFRHQASVHLVAGSNAFFQPSSVVICYVLSGCSGDAVVMLVNTHSIKHRKLCVKDSIDCFSSRCLVNCFFCENFVRRVQTCLAKSYLGFWVGSGCEETCPVVFVLIGVREHIIIFGGPCDLLRL